MTAQADLLAHLFPGFKTYQHAHYQAADRQGQIAGQEIKVIKDSAPGDLKVRQGTEA